MRFPHHSENRSQKSESLAAPPTTSPLSLRKERTSQRLLVSSSSGVHKSVLNLVTQRLLRILDVPVPRNYLDFDIWFNSDRPSKSVDAIPDLMVKMWSTSCKSPCGLPRIHWLMENAFSQSDGVVMDKLRAYVRDNPELLVVGKLLTKEGAPYHSPSSKGSNVKRLRSSKRMLRVVGTKPCRISNAMGLIIIIHGPQFIIQVPSNQDGPIVSVSVSYSACCNYHTAKG